MLFSRVGSGLGRKQTGHDLRSAGKSVRLET